MEIILCAMAGACVGEVVRRYANRLTYRLVPSDAITDMASAADEDNADGGDVDSGDVDETILPLPGDRVWMVVALAAIWAVVGWVWWPDVSHMALWLGFSFVGLYMAAVDLDVRRLPDSAQLLLAGVGVLGGVWAYWGQGQFVWGIVWALACAGGFLVIHLLSRGGLGFGDVKLMATCGWILGLNSSAAVLAGIMIGCVSAIAFSIATRTRVFAFGPWLLLGTLCGPLAAAYLMA